MSNQLSSKTRDLKFWHSKPPRRFSDGTEKALAQFERIDDVIMGGSLVPCMVLLSFSPSEDLKVQSTV